MSREGRRRVAWQICKMTFGIALAGGLVWGGIEIAAILRGNPKVLAGTTEAVPVKEIELITDGVLSKEWLLATLALPKGVSLMQLDLYQLQSRLLATTQVRSATLTRNFPSTLTVQLSEHSPVVRLMAQRSGEAPRVFLVARDGVVFEGIGFDPDLIETLPWLAGTKLLLKDEVFAPIAGMEAVADLLGKAKLEAEHLYRSWQIVSMERLESDGEIVVQAEDAARIVFGTQEDFFPQLARLDSLLDMAKAKTGKRIREVNLAIGAQVPVAFDDEPAASAHDVPASAAAASPARKSFVLPAFPNLQRNSKL